MRSRLKFTLTALIVVPMFLSACAPAEVVENVTPTAPPPQATMVPLDPSDKPAVPVLGEPTLTIGAFKTMKWSPIMRPDDHGENYWQIVDPEMGYPADGQTDFLMAHACEGSQVCIGDQLRDLDLGDVISHKGNSFEITEKFIVNKAELVDSHIWFHDPKRIVIITCVIDGRWQDSDKNEVLVAVRP